jgi:hypothetical protein
MTLCGRADELARVVSPSPFRVAALPSGRVPAQEAGRRFF